MSTGVGVSSCCLSGKIQEGKPSGREITVGGLNTYVSEPESDSTEKTIIFITDIFGWRLPNIRLLADGYAKAGFYCYVPDFHQGDSLPIEFLQDVEPPLPVRENLTLLEKAAKTAKVGTTLMPWLAKHREAVTKPLIDSFINAVRVIPGTNKIGVIGFCWGGRYAVLTAHGSDEPGMGVDAVYACHPSLVTIPGDFDPITKPISFAVGSKDSLLDEKQVDQIREILEKKSSVPHEIRTYEDQVHGFSLRGDWSSEKDKKAMDDAEKQGIEWFKQHLS
ncbi:alpha/beta-hydrolase [Patellaria atrata CBS 101060]|uniref:Alpha/beta-hydrolase n=1 Tax=Patellaria atrata CBS 101060 TaxID=1346257 RepID=A0A9P4SHE9_9PEZI|nr:alpha/beta-hydrolase [Patellaria atrata CBS 101060]